MNNPPSPQPKLGRGLADLADTLDLVLCDVWGVVHNGVAYHPSAVDALQRFRRSGGTVILITNAPAPRLQVQKRLDRLNVPRDAYDGIVTSGDVTIGMIVEAGCPPLFSIGPDGEYALFKEAGRRGPRAPRIVPIEAAELVVCVGLDGTGDRPEDYDANLQRMRERRLTFVCANPDIVVELGDDLIFCAGAIAERYEALGGAVIQAGKPFSPIYDEAFALAASLRGPCAKARTLAIGDAMHTDVRGAANQAVTSLFITSGIHRAKLHPDGRGSALDEAAFSQFLSGYGSAASPDFVLPLLSWTA